jgi:hypothetical protein
MKSSMMGTKVKTLLVGAAAVVLCSLPAVGAKLAVPQVIGYVTAITANVSITVDGKQYAIATGSPAANTVRDLHVGDQVGLMMDGPTAKITSHVTAILKQSAQ